MRLLTLNIAHGRGLSLYQGFHSFRNIHRNLERISHLLRRLRPNIVALQEVDERSHWNKHINLLEEIQRGAAYSYGFLGVHNRRSGRKQLAYGNAILSHHPISSSESIPFGMKSLGEKGYVFAEIKYGEDIVNLINLHLDFKSRRVRTEQVEQIIDYLDKKSYGINGSGLVAPIICGDFNTTSKRQRDAVQHLWAHVRRYTDYQIYPQGTAPTFPAHFPKWSLDFVLVPAAYEVTSCRVIRSYVSDHRPVLLQLRKRKRVVEQGIEMPQVASG
ncbi:MAG: endonuclease/exonuclease/phosphatase family protein [Opitutaceae bacterium]|nr:endonuclease/exonuclease/phosphatase family protein [Opitutaceae bacterium]